MCSARATCISVHTARTLHARTLHVHCTEGCRARDQGRVRCTPARATERPHLAEQCSKPGHFSVATRCSRALCRGWRPNAARAHARRWEIAAQGTGHAGARTLVSEMTLVSELTSKGAVAAAEAADLTGHRDGRQRERLSFYLIPHTAGTVPLCTSTLCVHMHTHTQEIWGRPHHSHDRHDRSCPSVTYSVIPLRTQTWASPTRRA